MQATLPPDRDSSVSFWRIVVTMMAPMLAGASDLTRYEKPLLPVTNPPPVQMLVPGFTVRELPLALNNLNSLAFAPDGRCFALAYDGNVLQLHDTDRDGIEDKATYFYRNDKNEIPPSIGMSWGPGGLYIASQGRVIRVRDRGDGTGELQTVTSGWVKPTGIAGSNLDSVGLAVNRDGEIFFGLGCDNWHDAYRPNKQSGSSDYNIRSERGTILKISRDWKRRDIVCTGLRFPVGLAFNAAGDLFCTDQEGATWLPNGNPFDELLHVQPGRHYGFPPRHPKYLPDAIDEPSTFDFAPQHQSTCGIHFNDGKKVFGPAWWRGDAFVAGESRGKIWRVKLVKTVAGYVAQNNLIACLSLLTIDAVPTPQGDLLVCCHSGAPDWGTGPQGKGKLFKISYTDKRTPQPVLAGVATPETRKVIFDRQLGRINPAKLAGASGIALGRYVSAGDRFESFRPGYRVVKFQNTMPRYELDVRGAYFGHDHRSVILRTDSRPEAVGNAISLSAPITADVLVDLTGANATWRDAHQHPKWAGWIPHLDLEVVRGLTAASGEHRTLLRHLTQRGTLALSTQVDLWQMLHPAVQPDAKLDFEYPPERVTLVLRANAKLTCIATNATVVNLGSETRVTTAPKENEWLPLELTLETGRVPPRLGVSWFTAEDPRERPLPLRRILVPAAKPYLAVAVTRPVAELAGGDWERGRKVFFSEPASCSKCHTLGGEGGEIGPNLSNLIYRDYASVLRDINEPSAAINPDHLSYHVTLKNGEVETGVLLRNDREEVIVGRANGQLLKIPGDKVAGVKASPVSVMPEGLLKALTAEQLRDLMTFLLTPPPKKLKVLVVTGGHGFETKPFFKMFEDNPAITFAAVEHTRASASAYDRGDLPTYDVIVLYDMADKITDTQKANFRALFAKGTGLVVLHHALGSYQGWPEYEELIGGQYREPNPAKPGTVTESVGWKHDEQIPVTIVATNHPVTAGLKDFAIHDEIYWGYRVRPEVTPLISTMHPKSGNPLGWAHTHGKSRVVYLQLGHGAEAFHHESYRRLLAQSIRWTAGR